MLDSVRMLSLVALVAVLWTGCEGRGVDLGLCSDSSVTCQCGSPDIQLQVQIPIKECTYFYRWKPYCKACDEFDEAALCSQFRNCLSCNPTRDGGCASCPSGRYGPNCQGVCRCENNGVCNAQTGACQCLNGFSGPRCAQRDAVTCSAAPSIANGRTTAEGGSSALEGTVVNYICNTGYVLVGPTRKRCESTGVWSGGEARCEYSCTVPTATPGLNINVEEYRTMATSDNTNGVPLIRRVRFTCDNGYSLQGATELNCLPSSQWNAAVPTCVRSCGEPPNLHNGRYEGTNWAEGGRVRYYCNDRWTLSGDSSLVCRDGTWTGTAPSCALAQCNKPVISNGIVTPDSNLYPVGNSITVTCQAGFTLQGDSSLTCLQNSAWNRPSPRCTVTTTTLPPVTCPTIAAPTNGRILSSRNGVVYTPGETIEFVCNDGFLISGTNQRICQATGEWSGREARCIRVITCADPGTPANAVREVRQPRVGGGGRLGGRGRLRRPGYLRPNSRVAGGDGSEGTVVDINLPSGQFRVLTRLTFECESRFYQLVGSQHRECLRSGDWSGRQPTCIPVCGKSEGVRVGVIRNGQVSRQGEWPWQVSIAHRQEDGQFYGVCGGTVISENWVVTAAHCVTNRSTANIMPLANLKLYLGKYYRDINQDDAEVQVSLASEIHVHPNYDPEVLNSDIALIRLASTATLSNRVSPICLPGYNSDGVALADRLIRPGSNITVTGWGETENRTDAGVLMMTVLGTISRESCEDKYAESGLPLIVTSKMFCAGHDDGRSDTCFGDSGGPAMARAGSGDNRRWYLVGVVSWGSPIDCGIPMQYSGFTKLSQFLSFINQFTGL
ncbi:limulus clotting factor C-like [Liolophura sinensis]|uniref:limulus clotting factor C-like n=1 Tax=Liolophura sinensis TaxID=3198878 RepID=UPI003158B254